MDLTGLSFHFCLSELCFVTEESGLEFQTCFSCFWEAGLASGRDAREWLGHLEAAAAAKRLGWPHPHPISDGALGYVLA